MKPRLLVWLCVISLGGSVLSLAASIVFLLKTVKQRQVLHTRMVIIDDDQGVARAMLTTLPDGAPQLTLFDQSGIARAEFALTPLGFPGLSLLSKDGRSVLTVTTRTPGENAEITLADPKGERRWQVRIRPDGYAELKQYDPIPATKPE